MWRQYTRRSLNFFQQPMYDGNFSFDFAGVLDGRKSRMEIWRGLLSRFASRLQRLTYFGLIGPHTFF